jgi:hypothetical protein
MGKLLATLVRHFLALDDLARTGVLATSSNSDAAFIQCNVRAAIRELYEETGIRSEAVEVVAELPLWCAFACASPSVRCSFLHCSEGRCPHPGTTTTGQRASKITREPMECQAGEAKGRYAIVSCDW